MPARMMMCLRGSVVITSYVSGVVVINSHGPVVSSCLCMEVVLLTRSVRSGCMIVHKLAVNLITFYVMADLLTRTLVNVSIKYQVTTSNFEALAMSL